MMDIVFKTEEAVFNYRVAGIWIQNGHVLMHRDSFDTNSNWALPGGRVAMLEDSESAIIREMEEELGMKMQVERMIFTTENFFEYDGHNVHEIGFYYKIFAVSDESKFQKEEFYGKEGERLIYKYVKVEELEQMELYPEFLRTGLKVIPEYPKHIIVK